MVKSSKTKEKINGDSSDASMGPEVRSNNATTDKLKEHQQNFTKAAKETFEKISKHAKNSKVDHKALIESHKKNLKVLSNAHKKTAEVMKSIATLQSQFVKQTFEDLNTVMRSAMTQKAGKPIDLSGHTDTMKNSLHRAVDHAQNISSMLSSSGKEIHASVHERMEESKEEIKAHMAKQRTQH
jgi:hypothetical protein